MSENWPTDEDGNRLIPGTVAWERARAERAEKEAERLRRVMETMRGWEDWRIAGGGYAAAFRGVMADIEAALTDTPAEPS